MDTIFKKSSVSISNLENELYTFSSINHIRYKYLHFRQGSEMIYLVFVDHLQCVKNSDKKWWRGRSSGSSSFQHNSPPRDSDGRSALWKKDSPVPKPSKHNANPLSM